MEKIQTGQKPLADVVACPRHQVRQSPEYKRRALHYLKHSWKVYSLSRALAKALEDSREASSWPGDRLQVGSRMSRRVELITQRLQRETDAYVADQASTPPQPSDAAVPSPPTPLPALSAPPPQPS